MASRGEVRLSLVLAAVRCGVAAEQTDFTVPELRLAAHLHRQVGELLSATQYDEEIERRICRQGDLKGACG